MNTKPLVSVIIPVYNGQEYLRHAINSVLAQTYDNIEIIVVNDGSNDSGFTEKEALDFGDKIRYYRKDNGGVSSALNFGIQVMRGNWFSWLSHDDLYCEGKIENQINLLNKQSGDESKFILMCKSTFIDGAGDKINLKQLRSIDKGIHNGDSILQKLFAGATINGCTLLIHKNIFLKFGFFSENYRFIQDLEYWIRIANYENNFIMMDEFLVKTRVHAEQQTKKISDLQEFEIKELINNLLNNNFISSISKKSICAFAYFSGEAGVAKYFISNIKRYYPSKSYMFISQIYVNTIKGFFMNSFLSIYRLIINKVYR